MQESWILEKQLDLISNRSTLWTIYGIRSLSKTRCNFLFIRFSLLTGLCDVLVLFEIFWNIKEFCYDALLIWFAPAQYTWNATQSMIHPIGEAQFGWTWITWSSLLSTTTLKVNKGLSNWILLAWIFLLFSGAWWKWFLAPLLQLMGHIKWGPKQSMMTWGAIWLGISNSYPSNASMRIWDTLKLVFECNHNHLSSTWQKYHSELR